MDLMGDSFCYIYYMCVYAFNMLLPILNLLFRGDFKTFFCFSFFITIEMKWYEYHSSLYNDKKYEQSQLFTVARYIFNPLQTLN